jgi:hypothetical protein
MNKLYVALKLLMLLNERKGIDSGLVADELNVSLRTAQRYLNELAGLPCVTVSEGTTRTYSLAPGYRLNSGLFNGHAPIGQREAGSHASLRLTTIICKVCGNECEVRGQHTGHGLRDDRLPMGNG